MKKYERMNKDELIETLKRKDEIIQPSIEIFVKATQFSSDYERLLNKREKLKKELADVEEKIEDLIKNYLLKIKEIVNPK